MAQCTWCTSSFPVGHGGLSAVNQHIKNSKTREVCQSCPVSGSLGKPVLFRYPMVVKVNQLWTIITCMYTANCKKWQWLYREKLKKLKFIIHIVIMVHIFVVHIYLRQWFALLFCLLLSDDGSIEHYQVSSLLFKESYLFSRHWCAVLPSIRRLGSQQYIQLGQFYYVYIFVLFILVQFWSRWRSRTRTSTWRSCR